MERLKRNLLSISGDAFAAPAGRTQEDVPVLPDTVVSDTVVDLMAGLE
jgi:hypothetical protein